MGSLRPTRSNCAASQAGNFDKTYRLLRIIIAIDDGRFQNIALCIALESHIVTYRYFVDFFAISCPSKAPQ